MYGPLFKSRVYSRTLYLDQIDHLDRPCHIFLSKKAINTTLGQCIGLQRKISFLGHKLWPRAIKRFTFDTPFEGPLLPFETDQVTYLCHFSSRWELVYQSTLGNLWLVRLSRSAMHWPRYSNLLFTYIDWRKNAHTFGTKSCNFQTSSTFCSYHFSAKYSPVRSRGQKPCHRNGL